VLEAIPSGGYSAETSLARPQRSYFGTWGAKAASRYWLGRSGPLTYRSVLSQAVFLAAQLAGSQIDVES